MSKSGNSTAIVFGFLAFAVVAATWYLLHEEDARKGKKTNDDADDDDDDLKKPTKTTTTTTTSSRSVDLGSGGSSTSKSKASATTTATTNKNVSKSVDSATTATTTSTTVERSLNDRIEELDQKGKKLYKAHQFLEAAQVFTEALELLDQYSSSSSSAGASSSSSSSSSSLASSVARQRITLRNNRSAMYEKAKELELAKADCYAILEEDYKHTKTRIRLLRILETAQQYEEALVQVCALQLLFMQENRDKIRHGLPLPQPPVTQNKIEELIALLMPQQIQDYETRISRIRSSKSSSRGNNRSLPSDLTILQLLKSFTGYNSWMAQAAKDGSVESITLQLDQLLASTTAATSTETAAASGTPSSSSSSSSPAATAERASLLLKRGRRHVYDRHFALACDDFEDAFALVENNATVQAVLPDGDYARLLEWVGTIRHWQYELDSALECYKKCSDLEPTNVELLVKQAGVLQDAGKQEEALRFLDTALGMDPNAVDAYFHRGNFHIVQQKLPEAKADFERCLELRPDHLQARLRLAPILMADGDVSAAEQMLDVAEKLEPRSADVHLYRGELYFMQSDIEQASKCFDKAIALEPRSPQPYVNAAAAVLNTPPPTMGAMPDIPEAVRLLKKAIELDPQFHTAYVQLGQMLLGTATDLNAAREVIKLYDQGLEHCRAAEEVRSLCGMRILTVAQVEAAKKLKMETFSMQ